MTPYMVVLHVCVVQQSQRRPYMYSWNQTFGPENSLSAKLNSCKTLLLIATKHWSQKNKTQFSLSTLTAVMCNKNTYISIKDSAEIKSEAGGILDLPVFISSFHQLHSFVGGSWTLLNRICLSVSGPALKRLTELVIAMITFNSGGDYGPPAVPYLFSWETKQSLDPILTASCCSAVTFVLTAEWFTVWSLF